MGCGNSKAVKASDAPIEQVQVDDEGFPVTAPNQKMSISTDSLNEAGKVRSSKVQVAPAKVEPEVMIVQHDKPSADRDAHSASSTDSGFDDNDRIITETTKDGERLAGKFMASAVPTDLLVTGAGFGSRGKLRDTDSAQSRNSGKSSFSTSSAPSILERPKSRGGFAFDITYDSATAPRPARLKSLESQKSGSDLTLEQLEKKLRAAERRRVDYERRVKAKMLEETTKVAKASTSLKRERTTLDMKIDKQEDKATENRRKHLEGLRSKLKAKEAKAQKVRANRELRRLEQEEALKNNRPTTAQAITA